MNRVVTRQPRRRLHHQAPCPTLSARTAPEVRPDRADRERRQGNQPAVRLPKDLCFHKRDVSVNLARQPVFLGILSVTTVWRNGSRAMFSRTSTRRRRTGESSIAVVLSAFLLYVISYGPVLAYCIHTQQPGSFKAINAVMTIYRPLALVAPESFMREYTRLCGFSDFEAFLFVEGMRRGSHLPWIRG